MSVMAVFVLVGTVDRLLGNRFGYGEEFEKGVKTVGPLMLVMAATYAVAPALAKVLLPVVGPIYRLFGADASMCAGTILAIDMGGYPLAMEMTENAALGSFSGMIIGSTMGAMMVGTIPLAISYLKPGDKRIFAYGILIGILTIPLSCIAGGLSMGLGIGVILQNLLPLLVLDGLIAAGLIFLQSFTVRLFTAVGTGISMLIAVLFGLAAVQYMTGIRFPFFGDMLTLEEGTGISRLDRGLAICGQIGLILAGAFPMFAWLSKRLKRPIAWLGGKMGVNDAAVVGLLANQANALAMLNLFDRMDERGKLLNIAAAVSLSYVLGDHLAFVAGVDAGMVVPVLLTKLTAGVSAIILAWVLAPKIVKPALPVITDCN